MDDFTPIKGALTLAILALSILSFEIFKYGSEDNSLFLQTISIAMIIMLLCIIPWLWKI